MAPQRKKSLTYVGPRLPPATFLSNIPYIGAQNTSFKILLIVVPPEGHLKNINFKRPQKYLICHIDNNTFLQ
jgi:hypothetical protein